MASSGGEVMELIEKQQAEKKEEEDNNPRLRKKSRKRNGYFATPAMQKHITKNNIAKKIEVF